MTAGNPLLEAEDLHRSYPHRGRRYDRIEAVAGIGLAVDVGEAFGIVGQSGAGKSTLARLLLALETPDRGWVRFDGHPISSLPESEVRILRRRFQAVFQDPSTSLDPRLTVETIIAEPLRAHRIGNAAQRRARVRELLNGVGLPAGSERSYPSAFSGGERQRLTIARAILKNPPILILDEATSALDTESERLVQNAIEHLVEDRTALVIAHRLSTIRQADMILVMSKGELVERGNHDELLARRGLYHKLHEMQFASSQLDS